MNTSHMRECLILAIVSWLLFVGRTDSCLAGPTDEAAKQGIEQKLRETEIAWKAGDTGRAVGFVENAYQLAKASLEPRDPLRRKVLEKYTIVNAQNRHEWTADEAADLLVEVEKNFFPQEEPYQQIQSFAIRDQGRLLLEKAQRIANGKNGTVDEAHKRLRDDADTLQKTLQQAGVNQAVTKLAYFPLAKFQQDHKLFSELQRTLDTIKAVIDDARVSPRFRGVYYNQMGLLQTELQNFATARDYSDQARNLAETTDTPAWARSQINLGYLALLRGDYRVATSLLQEVDAKRNDLGQAFSSGDQAYLMNNLAKVSEWNNDYDRAHAIINETLKLVTKEGQQNSVAECLCLNNRAINAYLRGKFEDARSDLTKARRLAEEHFGPNHLRVAEVDANLGWVALAFDDIASAQRRFRTAANVVREHYGDDHPRTAEMLSYQSRALFQLSQPDEARVVLLSALDMQEKRLKRVLRSSITERDRLAFVQNLRVHAESPAWPGVFDTFLQLAPQLGISHADQYAHVLTWKGIVAAYRSPPAHELENDPPIRQLVMRRNEILQQLRAAYVEELSSNERAKTRKKVDELQQRANELEQQLRSLSPRFTASFRVAPIEPAQIQKCLSDAAALLDIVQVRRYKVRASDETVRETTEYVGFVLKPAGNPIRIDFGPAQPINDAIRTLLRQLPSSAAARGGVRLVQPGKGTQPSRTYQDVADELRELVVRRLQPHLENVRLLITAPDGAFHRIPLSLLPGADREFWIEELAFATTQTAQALVRRRETRAECSGGLLAVGGVDFGSDSRWEPLKGTDQEIDEIKTLFETRFAGQHVDVLKGRDASKQRLLKTLPQHRYVHFATHGAFADRQTENSFDVPGLVAQLDSRLVLSEPDAGRPRDDQYLTAEELGGLPLHRTELVVLSACDTGRGYVSAGQTVIGMIGALDQAGVKTILGSLWKVDDKATVELMKAFYDQLWAHQLGPAEALRAAQLKFIRGESGDEFRHPKYWAAFIIAGEPGNVATDSR